MATLWSSGWLLSVTLSLSLSLFIRSVDTIVAPNVDWAICTALYLIIASCIEEVKSGRCLTGFKLSIQLLRAFSLEVSSLPNSFNNDNRRNDCDNWNWIRCYYCQVKRLSATVMTWLKSYYFSTCNRGRERERESHSQYWTRSIVMIILIFLQSSLAQCFCILYLLSRRRSLSSKYTKLSEEESCWFDEFKTLYPVCALCYRALLFSMSTVKLL